MEMPILVADSRMESQLCVSCPRLSLNRAQPVRGDACRPVLLGKVFRVPPSLGNPTRGPQVCYRE